MFVNVGTKGNSYDFSGVEDRAEPLETFDSAAREEEASRRAKSQHRIAFR